ncbi:MAG: SDR family NAD(P)-dependent oxidoreductase [Actinobacteria bacterium]|jgi:NAD(P)-dependent dehydrogenase (short-subunit alcohol dehydrogenase family)|nr:MAG: SDR family NAD(P)-dependent oxidoreductase [Actinomycetota bacterium]
MKDLKGRVAAITGTASGIGKATAILLAREGCSCAIADINEEGLRETEREIGALGAAVHTTVLDVADREAVYAWADEVVREFGRVNLVVNNAGVALGAKIEDMSYEDLSWLLGINLYGMIYGSKAFLPYLKEADEGHIVNISSVLGMVATPTQSAYTIAKFAIKGFTECLRLELDIDAENVSATVVHPGGIKTNIARGARLCESLLEEMGSNRQEIVESFDRMAHTSPEKAAAKIVEGIKKNRHRVLIGPDAYFIDVLQRLMPVGYLKITAGYYRLMDRLLKRRTT